MPMQGKLSGCNKSDLLTPGSQKNFTSSSKRKGKVLEQSHKDEEDEVGEASDHEVGSSPLLINYSFPGFAPSRILCVCVCVCGFLFLFLFFFF